MEKDLLDREKDPLGTILSDFYCGDSEAFLNVWSSTLEMSRILLPDPCVYHTTPAFFDPETTSCPYVDLGSIRTFSSNCCATIIVTLNALPYCIKLVALATILAMRPKVLLLDEPTNNLDPKTTSRLIEILQNLDLHQVIISHDWDFLSYTTNILYKIDHGHIHKCDEDHIHVHRDVHKTGDHPHQHNL